MSRRLPIRVAAALWCALLVLASGTLTATVVVALTSRRLREVAAELPLPPPGSPPAGGQGVRGQAVREQADAQGRLAEAALAEVRSTGIVIIAGLAILSVGLAWLVAGRILRPLAVLRSTARSVTSDQVDVRIRLGGPRDELRSLADTIDGMLDRLVTSTAAHRQFAADVAHELRNGLAVVRAEVDVALDDPRAGVDRLAESLAAIGAESDRLHRTIEGVLALSRAGVGVGRQVVDLGAVVEEEAARLDREVRADVRPAVVVGDQALITTLVRNLVDNAVRYGTAAGMVGVRCWVDPAGVHLRVSNDGPVLAPESTAGLFERHRRGTSSSGAGLGLSIVAAVVDAHQGSVTATARPAGGLDVTVRLPGADVAGARAPAVEPPGAVGSRDA